MMATFEKKDKEQENKSSDESDWFNKTKFSSLSEFTVHSSDESIGSLYGMNDDTLSDVNLEFKKSTGLNEEALDLSKLSVNETSNETSNENPITSNQSFEELGLNEELLRGIKSAGIEKPNDLQMTILTNLLNDHKNDRYIKTNPKSGKKTAFLISALQRIDPNIAKTQIIIISSSYEFVFYLTEAAKNLSKYQNISILNLESRSERQDERIKKNDQIIITTLSGFSYCLKIRLIDLQNLNCLIFDEIDALLCSDKSIFMKKIMNQPIGTLRQNVYFSNCTSNYSLKFVRSNKFNTEVNKLKILRLESNWMDNYFQFFTFSHSTEEKIASLIAVINNASFNRIVIYARKKNNLTNLLSGIGFKIISVSSSLEIEERINSVKSFNESTEKTILIVSAVHGLPLKETSIVINYDLPENGMLLPTFYELQIGICDPSGGKPARTKPAFVVNLIDKYSRLQFKRITKFFRIKMIRLIPDDDQSQIQK